MEPPPWFSPTHTDLAGSFGFDRSEATASIKHHMYSYCDDMCHEE